MTEIKISVNGRDTALVLGGLATGWVVRTIRTNKQWKKIRVSLLEAQQALIDNHNSIPNPEQDAVDAFNAAIADGPDTTAVHYRETALAGEDTDPKDVCSLRKLYRTNSEYVELVRRNAEFNALHSPTCKDDLCVFRYHKIVPYEGATGVVEAPSKWADTLRKGHEQKTNHRMMENLSIDEDVDSSYVCLEDDCNFNIKFRI